MHQSSSVSVSASEVTSANTTAMIILDSVLPLGSSDGGGHPDVFLIVGANLHWRSSGEWSRFTSGAGQYNGSTQGSYAPLQLCGIFLV